jgi:DNA repair protein RadD
VAHSIHLRDEFIGSGVRAAHIDGKTPKDERDEILKRLSTGDLELVTNCMVLTEGWDQPDVSCIVLARPTRQMGLYRQMVGRVLRPHPGKDYAIVLDHAGAVFCHGFVEEPVTWSLDTDKRAEAPLHASRRQDDGSSPTRLLTCTECSAVRTAGRPCGVCGHLPQQRGEYIDVRNGELAHVDQTGRVHPTQYTCEQKRQFYSGLVYLGIQRGNKPGAAAHRFKARFGHWPLDRFIVPTKPTAEVVAWDRHCLIRYAKAMRKAG